MAKYRKKPVVIDAIQWKINFDELVLTLKIDPHLLITSPNGQVLFISTLEGLMEAQIGDWIIRGVNGELYPCKPDIFEKTYESVE